jgi:tRNA pseudouridine38-40 synthase
MHTRNIKLVLEYDGTGFSGWQVQPGARTVQGVLEESLSDLAGEPITIIGAGRTDAGVHALGQVASAKTSLALPAGEIRAAVNARLPDDVLILSAEDVPPAFHARYSAVSRSYFYLVGFAESPIWRRHRWHVRSVLDVARMREALDPLRGEHDFSSFALTGSEPDHHRCRVAAISLEWDPRFGGLLALRVTADRFLRGMVRSIVGTLVEVGRGKIAPSEMATILDAKDRGRAGPTAPPWGLYLERVTYEQEVPIEDIP